MLIYILGGFCVLFAVLLVVARAKANVKLATVFKCAASLFFVAMGVTAYLSNPSKNDLLLFMLIGLIFGMVGDAILQMKSIYRDKFMFFVVLGMGGFFFGHIFYVMSVAMRYGITPFVFILPVVATVAMFFNLKRYDMSRARKAKWFGLVYYFLLNTFVALSVTAVIRCYSISTLLLAVGSVLFMISDTILVESYFGKRTIKLTLCNLATYYAAQILIAFSIFLF